MTERATPAPSAERSARRRYFEGVAPSTRRGLAPSALLAAVALAVAGCGGSGSHAATAASTAGGNSHALQGLILTPAKPAPPLSLNDYTGAPVSLAAQRGKASLVTFVYTHCPDVCPIIIANLANAQRQLGPAAREVSIIAVTVDPKGDTVAAVRQFLGARDAVGRMHYLLGSRARLLRTWRAWNVAVEQGPGGKLLAGHSAVVYGITASGRIADVYPANFTPAEIVHDVPLLARS